LKREPEPELSSLKRGKKFPSSEIPADKEAWKKQKEDQSKAARRRDPDREGMEIKVSMAREEPRKREEKRRRQKETEGLQKPRRRAASAGSIPSAQSRSKRRSKVHSPEET
jgi:hypothetical protein